MLLQRLLSISIVTGNVTDFFYKAILAVIHFIISLIVVLCATMIMIMSIIVGDLWTFDGFKDQYIREDIPNRRIHRRRSCL